MLSFRQALFAAGATLIAIGLAISFFAAQEAERQEDAFEALFFGFHSAFIALFSGVMIGVGSAFILDGLAAAMRNAELRLPLTFMLSALCALIATASIIDVRVSFPALVLFFSALSCSVALFVSVSIMLFCQSFKKCIMGKRR
ncbi:MAG: hypothetical protein N3E51_03965 [Candidatus Micrarchaeota archaeon]|nr:hypothetical protein [Candidatus Micrarchaeota archaeon]